MEITRNTSEVARLRLQIEQEYQAAERALSDLAMTGRHAFITARQQNIGRCFEALSTLTTPQEAIKIVAEALEQRGEDFAPHM